MTRRQLAAASLLTFALHAAACSGGSEDVPPIDEARSQKPRQSALAVPAADGKALSDGNAAFAMALYKEVEGKNPNLVYSPASITTALAMTFAGARNETEKQMAAALRFTLPQDRLHPAMNQLTAELAARGQGHQGADGGPFRLTMVNTLWAQKTGFVLEPGFLDVMAESYGAGVNLLDFLNAPEPSRVTINAWVSQQTNRRIEDLLPEKTITPDTQLVLTNAVYFNAAWKHPFKDPTTDGAFKRADGSSVTVPIMRHSLRTRGAVMPGLWTAVALPYQDERLSMLLVLPDPGKLAELEAQLAGSGPGTIAGALTERSVVLTMPRFKFETPIDLKLALQNLGMPIAFEDAADFSGISAKPLKIGAVRHKAFIAVAEKGTEAAAATAVVAVPGSAPLDELRVTLDRPFLFFVRDEPTGAILFMGRVADPSGGQVSPAAGGATSSRR